jgi:hypothetical protein
MTKLPPVADGERTMTAPTHPTDVAEWMGMDPTVEALALELGSELESRDHESLRY